MRLTILSTIAFFTVPALAQDSTGDCKESPCPIVAGPTLLSIDEADKHLIGLGIVRNELGVMLGIATCEKCTLNGLTPRLDAVAMLLQLADSAASDAEELAKSVVFDGETVKVADHHALIQQVDGSLPHDFLTYTASQDLDVVVESNFRKHEERALRELAKLDCVNKAFLSGDWENSQYWLRMETSCTDHKDNDCDGLADCGFMGSDFVYEADPDCACY